MHQKADARARGELSAEDSEIQRLHRLVGVESVLGGRLLEKNQVKEFFLIDLPSPHKLHLPHN